jgi:ribose 5-phosphate isomerase RpiB
MSNDMSIGIGSDHARFDLKGEEKIFLIEENHQIVDVEAQEIVNDAPKSADSARRQQEARQ